LTERKTATGQTAFLALAAMVEAVIQSSVSTSTRSTPSLKGLKPSLQYSSQESRNQKPLSES
jgi:hypothetical protein